MGVLRKKNIPFTLYKISMLFQMQDTNGPFHLSRKDDDASEGLLDIKYIRDSSNQKTFSLHFYIRSTKALLHRHKIRPSLLLLYDKKGIFESQVINDLCHLP